MGIAPVPGQRGAGLLWIGEVVGLQSIPMIQVRLHEQTEIRGVPAAYRIAGHLIISDVELPGLAPWAKPLPTGPHRPAPAQLRQPSTGALTVYDGPGWVGRSWRDIDCRLDSEGWWVTAMGIGLFWVAADGSLVAFIEAVATASFGEVSEILLGPCLALALAAQGTFMLHASAVACPWGMVLFLGVSGAGKSTLARGLALKPGWWLAADDCICVTEAPSETIRPLIDIPQPKLAPDVQPGRPDSGRSACPIKALIVVLAQPAAESSTVVQFDRVSARVAAFAVVQHTMAGRLYGSELRARHLEFASHVVGHIPTWEMSYPHRPQSVEQAAEWLASLAPPHKPRA